MWSPVSHVLPLSYEYLAAILASATSVDPPVKQLYGSVRRPSLSSIIEPSLFLGFSADGSIASTLSTPNSCFYYYLDLRNRLGEQPIIWLNWRLKK
jgi:hypothetical protein